MALLASYKYSQIEAVVIYRLTSSLMINEIL